VESILHKSYPGWKIVRLGDLRPEDRGIWVKGHGKDCPGIFYIQSKPWPRKKYVVTIFKKSKQLKQALLIISDDKNSALTNTLSKPESVAYLSVISKAPPGDYVGLDGKKVDVATAAILYEAIESGVVLYYPSGDGFKSMVLSD